MQLKSVLVRFYKSFNYDYERKIKTGVSRKPWEMIDGHFYPYVEINIDPEISAIVGANESGKSHLLSTIEKGLTGQNTSNGKIRKIERKDFCRYSRFFQAARGGPKFPDFGFEWGSLTAQDKNRVRRACNVSSSRDFDRFYFFRRESNECSIYLPAQESGEFEEFQIAADSIEAGTKDGLLPHVFRIESAIALPDTVPIEQLIKGRINPGEGLTPSGRRFAFQLMDFAESLMSLLGQIPEPINGSNVQLSSTIAKGLRNINKGLNNPQPHSDY